MNYLEILFSIWSFIPSNFSPNETFKSSSFPLFLFPPLILKKFCSPLIWLSLKILSSPPVLHNVEEAAILSSVTHKKVGSLQPFSPVHYIWAREVLKIDCMFQNVFSKLQRQLMIFWVLQLIRNQVQNKSSWNTHMPNRPFFFPFLCEIWM